MKGRSKLLLLCCCLPIHTVRKSHLQTRQFANRCSLVVSLGSTMTLCISVVKQATSSGMSFWYSIRA